MLVAIHTWLFHSCSQTSTILEPIIVNGVNDQEYYLNNPRLELESGVFYDITVVALNVNGYGPESNTIVYARTTFTGK